MLLFGQCGAALERLSRVCYYGGLPLYKERKLSLLTIVLVIWLTLLADVSFAASPGLSPEDAKNIMPVSQLKRGMKGYGLTVFQGTKIEKFDVEILGVLKKMNTGKDLIMVRIGGELINRRQTGIIAGMSGSPVYINGKVVGAISYGSGFAKEPVGMVTPIADMLEAWDDNLPKQASGYSTPQPLDSAVKVDGKSVDQVVIDKLGEKSAEISDGILHMQPLMSPMMVSGLSPRGMEKLSDILKPFGIQPVAGLGGGAAAQKSASPDLVPGAAVGVSLASGDIDLTSIGTVTYRRGNRIVGFGHPMLGIGAIDAPMSTAYITDILSSYQVSTKLGSPIKLVGRVFQDRPWCIAGQMGSMPTTIPVTISVEDESTKRSRVFRVNVLDHPLLASRLIMMIAGEAVMQIHPTAGDATANVSYEVNADQIGKISRSNVVFDPMSVDSASVSDMATLLQMLSSNPFGPLDIKSVNMKVKIADKRNTATIDRIFVKQAEYEPGDTVDVGVVLRPYKQDRITKSYKIKIPATAGDGKLFLQVRGGASRATGLMGAVGASPDADSDDSMPEIGIAPGVGSVDNVKQLVKKYLETEKNNEIVVQLMMKSSAINVAGEKLSGLPSSIADVMKSSRNSGVKTERDEVKATYPEDMIIYGSGRLMITIKRADFKENKTQPKIDQISPGDDAMSTDDIIASTMAASMAPASTGNGPSLKALDSSATVTASDETVASDDPSADTGTDSGADNASPAPQFAMGSTTSAPSTTGSATPQTDVKTVVRQAKTWSQKTQADFAKGKFSGISASSENKLELAPTLKKMVETPEQFIWSVAPAKDGVYAGTGNAGKIYHITDSGDTKMFYETGELEVHTLARDAQGNIYAGTSPNGKIFKISPDGKGQLLFKTPEKYVVALAVDPEGNIYAGVGDAGKIYRITPNGKGEVFADINEQQILSLHWDDHGSLLAGTGINGTVYRITKDGKVDPIFDADENSISAVTSDGKGNVYAGTSTKGVVYKIAPDGSSKSVWTKPTGILGLTSDNHDNIYAVSDGSLAKISPDGTVTLLDSAKEKVQYLAVSYNDYTGTLYASTGNIGAIYSSKCCDVMGTYESPVHDAKVVSRWGRIKWIADTPDGTGAQLQTRVGSVATPDSTWTEWSAPYTNSAGESIVGHNARYIQYRVTLKTDKAIVSPRVSVVTVSYLTPNQIPTVKLTAPSGGDVWSAEKTIKWTGSDPDKDTLTYDVYYSKDAGKNWTPLIGGVSSGTKPDAAKVVSKVKSELDQSKDIPQDMKDKVLKGADAAVKSGADSASASAVATSSNTSYKWNTKGLEDGTYLVKVIGSDKTSNASSALTAEAISEPFTVCNSAPKLTLLKSSTEVKASGSATISGSAASKKLEIVGVQFRVDGGSWMAVTPDDGVFDSDYEAFKVTTDNLSAGKHKVEVQAVDSAGNASNSSVDVSVS